MAIDEKVEKDMCMHYFLEEKYDIKHRKLILIVSF